MAQKQEEGSNMAPEQKGVQRRSWLRTAGSIAVLLLVFWVGMAVGNGNIGLHSSVSQNKSLPANLSYGSTEELYDLLKSNYDGSLDVSKLEDGLKSGLVKATGDPYTEYFNAKDAKEFNEQLSGTFSGIGAQLGKDDKDNIVVVAPIAGYPADKAGLKAKDIIAMVNGESTSGLSIDETVGKIRGKKGTTVKLGILRGDERKEFTITREDIQIPSVDSEVLGNDTCYIKINQFWDDTSSLVQEAVSKCKQAGVKGAILDLRGNPGGSLDAAVDVASVWLPSGKTVLQEKRDGKVVRTYTASGDPSLLNMPTTVLIDEGSASASEIVAGALKDNKAATLIGVKSYGKGSVQQVIPLDDGAEIKITVARWYRPNGQNIDKKGIKPDQEVQLNEEEYAKGVDSQKDAALQYLRK